MKEIVPPSIDIHGYTDDHALKSSFLALSRTEEKSSIHDLEKLASSVKRWMDQNKLKMNSSKTEFILLGSRQQLLKCETAGIIINNNLIKRSKSIKYLGADIDDTLNLKSFISRKCKIAMANLHKLKFIRNVLSLAAAQKVALGLVIAHLDYANALYSCLPYGDIHKLQRIQSMAAKVVTGARKFDSTTQALKSLTLATH